MCVLLRVQCLPLSKSRLLRESGDLRVEKELEVEGDVSVAAKLREVLDDEVIGVSDVLSHVGNVGREGEVLSRYGVA